MRNDTILVSDYFIKEFGYQVKKFQLLADKLDILAHEARHMYLNLDRTHQGLCAEQEKD